MNLTKKLPKVNFNLSNVADNSATVVLTMTVNGGRVRFSPGITVNPAYWDKKKQRLNGLANLDGKHAQGVNASLDGWQNLALKLFSNNPDISARDLNEKLKGERSGEAIGVPKEVQNTLNGFAAHYAQERKGNAANPRDFDNLVTTATYLDRYTKEYGESIYWNHINRSFARKFKRFLESPEFDLSQNQISNIFDRLRHIIKAASDEDGNEGYHSSRAHKLDDFKVGKEDPYRHYFDEDELTQFLEYDLSSKPYLERVRDMFVLNAYTGLRRSDAKRVSKAHLHVTSTGREQIKIYCDKPAKYVHVPLLPIARQILDKYNWELPTISDQKYNAYLKEAAKLAGLTTMMEHTETRAGRMVIHRFEKWERISSHDARRSFATNFYEKGFPASLLRQITGHAREELFLKYICTTPEKAAELIAERNDALLELELTKEKKS